MSAPDDDVTTAVEFTISGFDEVVDLHGDVAAPELVVFMGGNEFMVVPDLLRAFRGASASCASVFVETLPPGVLHEQLRRGSIAIGNLRISHPPDVFTAGEERLRRLEEAGLVVSSAPYASNRLALLVRAGNPKRIGSLVDLARSNVRVAVPDARTEDIGRKAEAALRAAGGDSLVREVIGAKAQSGSTHLTRIHHRETPARLLDGSSDAGFVWWTEGVHQRALGRPLELVELDGAPRSTSFAAALRTGRNPSCAAAYVRFVASPAARAVFERHGFDPPDAAGSR